MLRYLIFSDSHGKREPMLELYKQYPNDGIIHLGDYIGDARWLLQRTDGHPVYQVRGNCDYGMVGLEEQLLELGGAKLMLCHGHSYGVKGGYGAAIAAAKAKGADALLFGHTHQPYLEEREGILVMNPGSMASPFGQYGIIEIEDGKVKGVLLTKNG